MLPVASRNILAAFSVPLLVLNLELILKRETSALPPQGSLQRDVVGQ